MNEAKTMGRSVGGKRLEVKGEHWQKLAYGALGATTLLPPPPQSLCLRKDHW